MEFPMSSALESPRVGKSIQTYTGRIVYPLDLRYDEVDIRDIAHALSNSCRYAGHTSHFYSVAEHSVYVSQMAEKAARSSKAKLEAAKAGLLHDASEAYLVDLPRPVKDFMPEYRNYEQTAQFVISEVFDIEWPFPKEVHDADDRMLVTEMRDLMPVVRWEGKKLTPYSFAIEGLTPRQAEKAFLRRYHELFPKE